MADLEIENEAQKEVMAFFNEWQPTYKAMLAAMKNRFTDETIWENVGMSRTKGYAEAEAFMNQFSAQATIETAEVIVHHIASVGNAVLTERTDNFYDGEGNMTISIKLMGVFEMHGPKIVSWRDYYDTAAFQAAD